MGTAKFMSHQPGYHSPLLNGPLRLSTNGTVADWRVTSFHWRRTIRLEEVRAAYWIARGI
jgi:hypothetical protein